MKRYFYLSLLFVVALGLAALGLSGQKGQLKKENARLVSQLEDTYIFKAEDGYPVRLRHDQSVEDEKIALMLYCEKSIHLAGGFIRYSFPDIEEISVYPIFPGFGKSEFSYFLADERDGRRELIIAFHIPPDPDREWEGEDLFRIDTSLSVLRNVFPLHSSSYIGSYQKSEN